ncbi:hypothetical protein VU677_01880 [Hafnia paralvei]|uniref:hypothetical protein n=1 Tax=Hafnia TaxID=568 RepID=UPI00143C4425|nr:hypothetical protein [Hafnia sp. HMSC23F03]
MQLIARNRMKLFYAEKIFMSDTNFVVGSAFTQAVQYPIMLINVFKIIINGGS